MKTQNKVQLIGYVGTEPTTITLPNGTRKTKLRIATDQFFKKENGEPQQVTMWHDVVAWKKVAEFASEFFTIGSHVLVQGAINYRTFEDKTGHTRFITEIKASSRMNLDR